MRFDRLRLNFAILIVVVTDVTSLPHPSVRNIGSNSGNNQQFVVEKRGNGSVTKSVKNNSTYIKGSTKIQRNAEKKKLDQRKSDILAGSVEIDEKSIQGYVNLPNDNEKQQESKNISVSGVIIGSVELNDEDIEGHVSIPSYSGQQPTDDKNKSGNISRNVEVDDKNIEGRINLSSDNENQQRTGVKHQGGAVSGTVEIDDQNMEGNINFPSDIENNQPIGDVHGDDTITGTLELDDENIQRDINLPSKSNSHQNTDGAHESGTISGSVEINDENIKVHVNLSSDSEIQNDKTDVKHEAGAITGSVEIDDVNIQGRVNLPNDSETQNDTNDEKQETGAITGSVEIDEGNIEGHVNLPNDSEIKKDTNNVKHEAGVITGSVAIDDESIEGHINLPNDSELQENKNDVKSETGDIIGSIEIDDDNIQAHIDIPSDIDGQQNTNNVKSEAGDITGSIEIDDDNIQGHIDIPSDIDGQQNTNDVKSEAGDITGSVEIDDDKIQGHIDIPSDIDGQQNTNDVKSEAGDITGSVEIDDDKIQGHIDIPSDIDGQQNTNDVKSEAGDITGSVEIDDDNIQGHIDIPSDNGQQNTGVVHEDDAITDSIDIDDENSQIKIDPNSENEQQNADGLHENGNISGSVEINNSHVKGHVNLPSDEDTKIISADDDNEQVNQEPHSKGRPFTEKTCWMNIKTAHYLDALDKLDAKYSKVRQQYQKEVASEFDKKMMEVLLSTGGVASRAMNQAHGDVTKIPAGINLGGYCMMRMPGSLLFFHRMKLRNSTQFRVDFLSTQLDDMMLVARLSLYDLHLRGAYKRSTTDQDPSVMYYVPSFGELDVLLKSVGYKMEGHLRMLDNRLIIELVNSDLLTNEILLSYVNDSSSSIKLQPRNLEDFLERLKTDLDFWLKDYFNDYLMYFGIVKSEKNAEIQKYEKEKTIKVNEYADYAVKAIQNRLENLGAATVQLPHFTVMSVLNNQIKLKSGRLRGLDSIYRRSVATTNKYKSIRHIDFIVGFSKLKVEYQYEAMVTLSMPPLTGILVLSADELIAHVEISQVVGSDTFDINVDSIVQTKPESLTIEGPANRVIADFKHILEHPIIAIMTNIMKHNIKMLKSLTRCEPFIKGNQKSNRSKVNKSYKSGVPADNANEENPFVLNDSGNDTSAL